MVRRGRGTLRSVRRLRLAIAALAVSATLLGCGADDDPGRAAVDQARRAALDAGLSPAVADFLALAAGGTQATYEAEFTALTAGEERTIIVSQRPPDRRIDVVAAGGATDATILTGGSTFQCSKPPDGGWECIRAPDGRSTAPLVGGVFDEATLRATTDALADASRDFIIGIEDREVAGTAATCLVAEPRGAATTTAAGAAPDGPGSLCLSGDGAILLVEQAGERVAATEYSTSVAADRFELPAEPTTPRLPTGGSSTTTP